MNHNDITQIAAHLYPILEYPVSYKVIEVLSEEKRKSLVGLISEYSKGKETEKQIQIIIEEGKNLCQTKNYSSPKN